MANWLQRQALKVLGLEAKVSAAGTAIVATQLGSPVWSKRNFAQFADEGFIRNAIAFRCIELIAGSGAAIPLALFDKRSKKEVEEHDLLKLMNRPAPNKTGAELIQSVISYAKIAGNSYIEAVGPTTRKAAPQELYSLRPDRMRIIPGNGGIEAGFEYEANGVVVKWQTDPISGYSPILHLRNFHPLDDWYGLSAMEPAAYSIDRHNESGAHNMAVLQNGAVPSGALAMKPVTINGQAVSAPQDIIEKAEKRLKEQYSGAKNAGRPFVLGGNVEWMTFGQSMEELQLTESKLDAARDICTAFGVPFILLVPGQSTYNNNREAKLALYEETVMPTMDWLLDHLNNWLSPQFGDNLELRCDYDSVEALSIRREEKRKTFVEMYKEKLVTRTEVREALNYETLEGMPEFMAQSHEVTAIVTLVNNNKLSKETGWEQLKLWGMLPPDFTPEQEQQRLDEQAENDVANGLLGMEAGIGPDGKPLPPAKEEEDEEAPKPKPVAKPKAA